MHNRVLELIVSKYSLKNNRCAIRIEANLIKLDTFLMIYLLKTTDSNNRHELDGIVNLSISVHKLTKEKSTSGLCTSINAVGISPASLAGVAFMALLDTHWGSSACDFVENGHHDAVA